jgi:UDP-2,4-diacetamido-2,4,6-trideoxy-beta-L-altropyranose hydrolase
VSLGVALRADASAVLGAGHLVRCLSLAAALREQGADAWLVCARGDGTAAHLLRDAASTVRWIDDPDDPQHDARLTAAALADRRIDWIVVDHYRLDAVWHDAIRQATGARLLAIDDLADRPLAADALLDANRDALARATYAPWLRREPRWLLGPRFAMLGPAYRAVRRCDPGEGAARSIGVFTGGTDPGGASARVLDACRREAGFEGPIEVATTRANPRLDALRAACREADATLTVDAPDLAAFFARHDLQVGAGGGAAWERCRVGAPSIALVLADNQRPVIDLLGRSGAVLAARLEEVQDTGQSTGQNTGQNTVHDTELPPLATALRALLDAPEARRALAERAVALVDGRGAQRVAASLMRDALTLRPAGPEDAMKLLGWRNHAAVRAVSGDPAPIAAEDHLRWFARVLADPARRLWVGRLGALDVGSIRFDRLDTGRAEVSLYLDPELLGLGLGERLLAAGEAAAADAFGAPLESVARVLPGNDASLRLFGRAGYRGEPDRLARRIDGVRTTSIGIRP